MKLKEQTFVISNDGSILTIYDDSLLSFVDAGGDIKIARASHVEPRQFLATWFADLSPVGGPKLGPFKDRQSALDAELVWLGNNLADLTFPAEENDDGNTNANT